jgi:hypothetical protein
VSRQATIVAYWGDKPPLLAALLDRLRALFMDELGSAFRPYAPEQVHATLVGVERLPGGMRNRRLARVGPCPDMDLAGLRQRLLESARLPMPVRVGGFRAGEGVFVSRGEEPYTRSFSLQGDKAVLMGWPVVGGEAPSGDLDRLRREALLHHVLHAWHEEPGSVDDDLYMRIGLVDLDAGRTQCAAAVAAARHLLSEVVPLRFSLAAGDLSVASYVDEALPPSSTEVVPLAEVSDWSSLYD